MTEVSRVSSIDILKHKQGVVETSANMSEQTSVFGNPAAGASSNEVIDIEQLQQGNAEPEKIQVLRKNFKDFHLNLSSNEYKNMQPKEKSKYIINEFGKFLYGDEEKWNLLNDKEKASFLNTKINDYIKKYEPEKYGEINVLNKQDLEAMLQILTTSFEVALSTANGETDLEAILKNYHIKPRKEKFAANYNYVKQLQANGEELTYVQKEILMRGKFQEGLQQYIKDNNIENTNNEDEVNFNYLQSRIDENGMESLSVYEKNEYGALKLVKDKFGVIVDDKKNTDGLDSLASVINDNSEYKPVRDSKGNIIFKSDTTKHVFEDYITSNLRNYSSKEEQIKWFVDKFGNLNRHDTQNLFKILNDPHCKIENKNELLKALAESSASTAQSMTAVSLEDKNTTDVTRVMLGQANNTHIEKFAKNHDTSNADLLVDTNVALIRSSESENVQSELTVNMAETNYDNAVKSAAELSDSLGINGLVDQSLVNSKKASAESKVLYAQTSVEIQKNDEAKLVRNEQLNSYGNAYFTKGTVEALPSYETDEAVIKANNVINDTVENKLDKEGRKLVTQARMDVMPKFNSDLQKTMYEQITESKHDDVLETGAKNIYQLDKSIKDWATERTQNLGKDNVTNAIRTDVGQSNNTVQTSAYATEPQMSNIRSVQTPIALSPIAQKTVEEIKFFKGQKIPHDKAIEMFKNLSRKEQIEILHTIPTNQFDKLPVLICEFFPELIPTFVSKGKGSLIINSCSIQTVNRTIRCMQTGSNETKKQLRDMIASRPEYFAKSTQEWANTAIYNGKKTKENEEKKPFNALS